MKYQKAVFLFLALLLPIAVFMFLKIFGENKFEVTPLFQEAVDVPSECASFKYPIPYTVPDSVLEDLSWSSQDSVSIVIFNDTTLTNNHKIVGQVARLEEEFQKEVGTQKGQVSITMITDNQPSLRSCIFLLKSTDYAAVIDSRGRIMGIYNLLDLEDADRLILEIKIILKKY